MHFDRTSADCLQGLWEEVYQGVREPMQGP